MIRLLLDTNILHESGLNSATMQRLTRLTKEFRVQINIPYIVAEEYKTKKSSKVRESLSEISRNIENIKKTISLERELDKKIGEIHSFCSELESGVDEVVANEFDSWAEKSSAILHPLQYYYVEEVFESYFSGSGVFRKPKSRDDIPDAFIMKCIDEILDGLEEGEILYVAIKDGVFKRHLNSIEKIKVLDSLSNFLEVDEVRLTIEELDAKSEIVESIKEFLRSEEAVGKLYEVLMANDVFEYDYLAEDEVVDPQDILPKNSFSMSIDGTNIVSIDEIIFGSAKYNDEDSYSIDFELSAIASISYVAPYSGFLELKDDRKSRIEFDSMTGDGWCDLSETIKCKIFGSVDLEIFEEMTLEKIKVHFRYLNTHQSPVYVDAHFEKAELVSLDA